MLIDTHCHLNDIKAFPSPATAIEEARIAGVHRLIVIGMDIQTSAYALQLAEEHPEVFATIGWHPNCAAKYSSENLKELEEMLKHPKALAVGEIGLDYHWDYATKDQQHQCLMDQLQLAHKMGKPVVLHCRDAYPKLLDILEKQPKQKYLFHCFMGDENDLKRAIALDAWFGVDGPVTYKNADKLRQTILKLPRNKVVLETDSPWMPPHPHRGKPNKPAWLVYINNEVSRLYEMAVEDLAKLTTNNSLDFYGEQLLAMGEDFLKKS